MKRVYLFLLMLSFSPLLLGMDEENNNANNAEMVLAKNVSSAVDNTIPELKNDGVSQNSADLKLIMERLKKMDNAQRSCWMRSFHAIQVVGSLASAIGLPLGVLFYLLQS